MPNVMVNFAVSRGQSRSMTISAMDADAETANNNSAIAAIGGY